MSDNPFGGLHKTGGDWHSWANAVPGAQLSGVIKKMWVHQPPFPKDDGTPSDPVPAFELGQPDGSEINIACSQANLKNQMIERGGEFQVGGTLTITFSGLDGRVKLFSVDYAPPTAAPVAAAQAPAGAPPSQAPAGQAPPIA